VLGTLEAEEFTLLSVCVVAGHESTMAEGHPDVEMLEGFDPVENDGWLRRGHHHPGEGSDEARKDQAKLHSFGCC
jgi:hypothetical protein